MSDYTNSGILFKNDKKGNDKAPEYTGKINIDGTEKRLAAWVKDGAKGKFMSLKVSDFEQNNSPAEKVDNSDQDDLPFVWLTPMLLPVGYALMQLIG